MGQSLIFQHFFLVVSAFLTHVNRRTKPTPSQEFVLERSNLGINSVCLSCTSSLLVASGLDSVIRVWDLSAGLQAHIKILIYPAQPVFLREIEADPLEAWSMQLSPDARFAAVTGQAGNVTLWNIEAGTKEQTYSANGKFTMSVAFSPNSKYIACAAMDGAITVFEVSSGKRVHSLPGHAMTVRSLAFSHDSALLFSASDDKQCNIYDV